MLSAKKGQHVPMPKIDYFKGNYRGLGASLTRTCIINMIFFSVFEFLKKEINALDWD